jgi:hypothetical protein
MIDYLVAFGFVAMVLTPSFIATFCASERRPLRRRAASYGPAIERRDLR